MIVLITIDNWGIHVLVRVQVESFRDSICQQAKYESTVLHDYQKVKFALNHINKL